MHATFSRLTSKKEGASKAAAAAERYSPWTLYPRPEHLAAYTEFVSDVLRPFCGKASAVEVGNEPDSVVYYGSPLVPLQQGVPRRRVRKGAEHEPAARRGRGRHGLVDGRFGSTRNSRADDAKEDPKT